ncbi:tyrosinase-like protein orsC [Diplogelasinospora grovesii]|uniref:Tyrosinase-like protein orsC n=1 Tax=Diplogelasinospora grovesii TaxID=303347 RepID=A0AAN6N749_9PEZI|nr:tyrosinase-like protein orsC [Diplogelasinospora grovesii]
MKVASIATAAVLAALAPVALAAPSPLQPLPIHVRDGDVDDAQAQYNNLTAAIQQQVLQSLNSTEAKLRKRGQTPSCTARNIVFRREYGSLSQADRLAYVNAVKCLQNLPARTPANVSSGARSRFDDFVVTHIQQTLTIHYTGNFMPWHRWFVYTYEKALRDECGYTGYQPYWDWPRYASAPQNSPIFNGDPYSLGGNGEYIPHDGPVITPPAGVGGDPIQLPAGVGGGYVTTGPFANMTVNLGPVGGLVGTAAGPDGGLGYNPRGLKRDVGPAMNTRYANYTTVLNLLMKPNITEYRLLSEGVPYTVEIGPHGGIHYTISGDPGGDLFTSPGDPAFWVHHGMMDRMWTYWQAIDPAKRQTDLNAGTYGHVTWANDPPSALTQLTDVIDMGYAGPSTTIGEVMSTTSGPFCYFYL